MKKLLLIILAVFIQEVNAQVCFNLDSNIVLQSGGLVFSTELTSADFNADGFLDVALLKVNTDSVSVYFGDGTGNFSVCTNFLIGIGSSPNHLNSADLNNDNKKDLVIRAGSNLYILIANGSNSFNTAVSISIGQGGGAGAIAFTDLNSDGLKDIVTTGYDSTICTLLGTGAGVFGTPSYLGVTSYKYLYVNALTTSDFNNDGKTDIAAGYGNGAFQILLGNGTGGYLTGVNYSITGTNLQWLISEDFNNDSNVDIVIGWGGVDSVTVLLGNGTGTYSNSVNYYTDWAGQVVTADFNNDGFKDLGFTNVNGGYRVSIMLGTGSGSFNAPVNYAVSGFVWYISSSDFNNDGKPDLATTGSRKLNVLINVNCGVTGIGENNSIQESIIYPNPTSNSFIIETVTNELKTVMIFDVSGKQVLTQKISGMQNSIDVSSLSDGYYTLIIGTSTNTISKKLAILGN